MKDRKIGASERYDAVRLYIREVPLGPMPGFPMRIPRCVVTIMIPNTALTDASLLEIAVEQKNRVLSLGKHYCAMSFYFWTEGQKKAKRIGKEEATAAIDYAPNGKWEDALDATLGNYSTHIFKIISNKMKEE